jgi:glycosyltransferase involved in cell wall biosynthesis/SAM-dependent methyltransferase
MVDRSRRFPLIEELITGLDDKEFSQTIVYLRGDSNLPNFLEDHGYKVISCGFSKKELKRFNWPLVKMLSDVVRNQAADIIHCQRHKPTVYGASAAWLSGVCPEVISTVHGRERTRNLGRRLGNRMLSSHITRIVAVSESVRRDILRSNPFISPLKVVTIYNGIDIKRFSKEAIGVFEARKRLGIPERANFVFGTVGRLSPVKGHDLLLSAFAEVCSKRRDTFLAIIGEGPLKSKLLDLVDKLKLSNKVLFLGFRNDIPKALKAIDAFILPSLSEGLPLSLLEAMASGLPVIANRVGGIPEVLKQGNEGIMVPDGSVDALVQAMLKMRDLDAADRRKMGQFGRQSVLQRFSIDRMISDIKHLYQDIVKFNLPDLFSLKAGPIEDLATTDRLTEKSHWDERWGRIKLPAIIEPNQRHPVNRKILSIFDACLPKAPIEVLEIGGAPGQFLAYFSKYHGYSAHALDYSETGCRKIRENFNLLGMDVTVYRQDLYEDLSEIPLFDMVFSMGLVEHFADFESVLKRHLMLLKPGGVLVLGVPNYDGIYKWGLNHLAPKMISLHNLDAMNLRKWRHCETLFALKPIFRGYIGGFEPKVFRRCEIKTVKNQAIRLLFKIVRFMVTDRIPSLRNYNSSFWSAYLLGIYRYDKLD